MHGVVKILLRCVPFLPQSLARSSEIKCILGIGLFFSLCHMVIRWIVHVGGCDLHQRGRLGGVVVHHAGGVVVHGG